MGKAEIDLILGKEGQEFINEQRESNAKLAEGSKASAIKQKNLTNTQDILKEQGGQTAILASQMQGHGEELLQIRLEQIRGNRAELAQLGYAQLNEWKEEVGKSFTKRSLFATGGTFADFIDGSSQSAGGTGQISQGQQPVTGTISGQVPQGFGFPGGTLPNGQPNGGWGTP